MTGVEAISATGSEAVSSIAPLKTRPADPPPTPAIGFGDLFARGMKNVEDKVQTADLMVRKFALDDSVPIHQVTIALEEARIAVDLALQVRSQLIEAYREVMNTQL